VIAPRVALPRPSLGVEATGCALVAAAVAAVLAWGSAPGTDFAAHAYQRALFLHQGFVLWDNFWYAGRYSFVTYSLLYYPLAALLGIRLLAVLTVALAALAFALVLGREWGTTARWAGRAFAVVWAGLVVSAAYPFALGAAAAFVALLAAQAGRRWRFVAAAAVTVAASPLAFLFLLLALGGIALTHAGGLRRIAAPAAAVGLLATIEGALVVAFPTVGHFPFPTTDLLAALVFSLTGAVLLARIERARPLALFFAGYSLLCLVSYAVPTELGSNVSRIRFAAFPLAVLTMALRRWRPLPVTLVAATLALSWNVSPVVLALVRSDGDPELSVAYWRPATEFLRAHRDPSFRVEAVDTAKHAPAFYLAGAGVPLARGWFRQDDFPLNQVLYEDELRPVDYLRWLRELSVRWVVLSTAPPDYSSKAEAALLRSGRSGLPIAFRSPRITIFRVPDPRPLLTGPGEARVLRFGHDRVVVWTAAAGTYRLGVRWSPYWRASAGCLTEGADGMLRLATAAPGQATLRFESGLGAIVRHLAGERTGCALPDPVRAAPAS
jgi:hypothetical protein